MRCQQIPHRQRQAHASTRLRACWRRRASLSGHGHAVVLDAVRAWRERPDIVALVSRGSEGAAAMHLFSAVHYLLLRDPGDSLSRYFATLTPDPAAPEDAFPEFVRFCREHREELLQLLDTRTVQTTFAERCRTVLPLLSRVADEAGEPLNLVELGCSAEFADLRQVCVSARRWRSRGCRRCAAHVVACSNGWEAAAHSEDRYSHRTRSACGERQIRRRTSLAPGAQLSRASPTAGALATALNVVRKRQYE